MKLGIGGKIGPVRLGVSTRGYGVGIGPVHASGGYGRRRSSASPSGLGAFIGVLVGIAVVLVLLPLAIAAATIYGLALMGKGLRRSETATAVPYGFQAAGTWSSTVVRRRPALVWAGVGVVAVSVIANVLYIPWLVHAFTDKGADHNAAATSSAPMPRLNGWRLDRAENRLQQLDSKSFAGRYTHLSDFDENLQIQDLSRTDGDPMEYANWIVVSAAPSAGSVIGVDTRITLQVVRTEAYRWYKLHPTMPALRPGTTRSNLGVGEFSWSGVLSPVAGLVTVRRATRTEYRAAHPRVDHGLVATIPAADQPLQPGERITVLIAPRR